MRYGLLVALVLSLAACRSASHPQTPVHASLGKPPARNSRMPPPAWIETTAGRYWLGAGSSCWSSKGGTLCADKIPPTCQNSMAPSVPVSLGETVRVHLGFTPSEVSVDSGDAKLSGRTVRWKVRQPGVFSIFSRGSRGDASYVGCAVTR